MKKVFAWILRIICFALILAAVATVVTCVIHMNDDYSYEAVMGHPPVTSETPAAAPVTSEEPTPSPEAEEAPAVEITLETEGEATTDHPEVDVTATFSGIDSSLQAELHWYLDGAPLEDLDEDRMLVDGTAVTVTIPLDASNRDATEAVVELTADYEGGSCVAGTVFPVDFAGDELPIRTEEITVTCIQDASIYSDSKFSKDTGKIIRSGETGLLLSYEKGGENGLDALELQFPDGTEGWVSARRCQVTEEDCTTTEDYTDAQKVGFVNSMGYESVTGYLVWVNLYTQKVNVFQGTKGDWTLVQSFPCSTGVNTNPTTIGIFSLTSLTGHWDLAGGTYVDPVMIFNGGEAFTSQPKDSTTREVVDDTMGTPSSGGSVRMLEDDITWMARNLYVGTTVVVY